MVVDEISVLNMYLKEGSVFTGAINPDGKKGEVYVELSGGSKWVLAGDSYITSLTCEADSIDLNGYTLIVEGDAYTEGTSSNGNAIEIKISEGNGKGKDMQAPPEGEGVRPPKDGDKQPPRDNKTGTSQDDSSPNPPDGEPPAKPDGEPPAKPDGEKMPGGENPPDKPE